MNLLSSATSRAVVLSFALTLPSLSECADVSRPYPPNNVCVDNKCTESTQDFHPSGYTLTFSDEFNGTELDRSKWCTRYLQGGGATPQIRDSACEKNGGGSLDFLNDERQRYVDSNTRKETMHVVAEGTLTLRATKTRSDSYAPYESAMIRSKQLFIPTATVSYYITARVMLPDVRGTWPALWLASDWKSDGTSSWPPEIDIFEGALNEIDDTANMLHMSAIVKAGSKQTTSGIKEITFSTPQFDTQWYNYRASGSLRATWLEVGALWTVNGLCYFVDGQKLMCENYVWRYNDGNTAVAAHILFNLAIGGEWAGRYGIADEKMPATLRADYIRVYRKSQ